MYARHSEIESYHRELREQSLHEGLTPMALRRRLCALNTMQEFRSGDRGYSNIRFCVTRY